MNRFVKNESPNRVGLLVLLPAAFLLSGCASTLHPEVPRSTGESRQLSRNYEIGAERTVNVGDPIVKFHDYWAETIEEPVVLPKMPIRVQGGPVDLALQPGVRYPIRGKIIDGGVEYSLVATSDNPVMYQALLMKGDGTVHDRVVTVTPQLSGPIMVVYTMTVTPAGAKLQREKAVSVKTSRGYENFELLYTGRKFVRDQSHLS